MSKLRKDIAQAMNSATLVAPMTAFLEDYGPCPKVAHMNVDKCKDYLRGRSVLQGDSWKGFPTLPSKSGMTEPMTFAPFEVIVNAIWDYAKGGEGMKRNVYLFKMVPHNHLEDSLGGADHKMDACVLEVTYKEKLPNHRIMIPWEFKNVWTKTKQIELREQVAGDCHQILCDDPRRMFMFGVTVEDNRFSLWYFSRSHSVKARAINWLGDGLDDFIRIILSFAYATPADLGVDPHVFVATRQESNEGQQYVYELDAPEKSVETLPEPTRLNTRSPSTNEARKGHVKVYYRTVCARSPMRPNRIAGRTTRVWEVVQVSSVEALPEPGAEHVILKDVWVDADLDTEAENQTQIFETIDDFVEEGLKTFTGPDGIMDLINSDTRFDDFNEQTKRRLAGLLTNKEYRNLFLTNLVAWKGALTKERSRAANRPDTPIFARRNVTGKKADNNRRSQAGPSTSVIAQTEVTSVISQAPDIVARRQYEQKQQARFVYKEICKEIYKLPTFGDVVDVIRQALDSLQILFCAGWVHRDISTGNILAVPITNGAGQTTGWQVKLADLEFSHKFGQSTNKTDPRTGTPFFMPVEIMKTQYLAREFEPWKKAKPSTTLAAQFKLAPDHGDYKHYLNYRKNEITAAFKEPPANAIAENNKPGYLTYNYQHDLESIWWTILFFITACADHEASEIFARKIFVGKFKADTRKETLMRFIDRRLDILHESLSDAFPGPIETLRLEMYHLYVKRLIFGQIDIHTSYSSIHATFAEQLDLILEDENDDWKSLPLARMMKVDTTLDSEIASEPFGSTKHGLDDDEPEGVTTNLKRARIA